MGTFLGRRLDAWPGERAASLLRVGDDVHSPRQRPYFKRNLPYQGRPEKPPPGLTSGVRCHRTEALEWSRRSCQISRRASTGSVPRGYLWLRMAPPWSSPAGYNRGNKTRLLVPARASMSGSIAGSNHGPATTEIDSPHLRGRRRLNRRVNLILSQSPSTDVNPWEFDGNRCGNTVGMWELDWVSMRSKDRLQFAMNLDERGHTQDT